MSVARLTLVSVFILSLLGAAVVSGSSPSRADHVPSVTNVRVNASAEVPFPRNGQNQPALAQNPSDAANLIASSNDELSPDGQGTGFYASFDGGVSWPCQGHVDLSAFGKVAFGDAWQTFDSSGNAYLSTIALPIPREGKPGKQPRYETADIFVAKSVDGGCSYPAISKVASQAKSVSDDKPSIAADENPLSPHADNVYVAWTQYKGAAQGVTEHTKIQIVVARSADGGRSWSKPVGVSDETTLIFPGIPPRQGANVQVGPDGTVYVAWADTIDFMFVQQIAMSRDGGKTFSEPITVAAIADDFSSPGGATFRQLGRVLPSFSISPEGQLYLGWAERWAGHTVAVLTKSVDGGLTWTPPAVAGDVADRSAFFTSVAAGPSGAVHVAFLALDDLPDGTPPAPGVVHYDAYAVSSFDGGATFSTPVLISQVSSDPNPSSSHDLSVQFIGDYIMAVADAMHLYVAWTDTRNGLSCPAVDAFRLGAAPPPDSIESCPLDFGNADIYLGIVPTQ